MENVISGESSMPLSMLRVLDCSNSVASQYCGRLFADYGASVTLVEPLGGSSTRHIGPFVESSGGQSHSSLFWHLNQGKTNVTIDLTCAAGLEIGRRLAQSYDVLIVDSWELERELHDDLKNDRIDCVITPFGDEPPWNRWQANEMIAQALSGTMSENGRATEEPLFGVGHRASYAAGTIGYIETLSCLLAEQRSARTVDVSVVEVAASMNYNRITQFHYNGTIQPRGSLVSPLMTIACADGWVTLFIDDERWEATCVGLGLCSLMADERFVDDATRAENWDELKAVMEKNLRVRNVDEVVAAGQAVDTMIARSWTPAQLKDCPQLAARQFWVTAPGPDGREWCVMQSGFRFVPALSQSVSPAPDLASIVSGDSSEC